MLRPGDRLAGRFEVGGDQQEVAHKKAGIWRLLRWGNAQKPVQEDDLWLHAVDRQSGAPVQIDPRGELPSWGSDVRTETIARQAMAMQLSSIVKVLHVGPGVVYAPPPPASPRPALPLAAAAECALEACEVVARLHAVGCGGGDFEALYFGPRNLRVGKTADGWHIAWLVPGHAGLAQIDLFEDESLLLRQDKPMGGVERDVRRLVAFFFSLVSAEPPEQTSAPKRGGVMALLRAVFQAAPVPEAGSEVGREGSDPERAAALRALEQVRRGEARADPITDVASLAQLFLPLVASSAAWAARVASLPRVGSLPRLSFDWDGIIADGEAQLAEGPRGAFRRPEDRAFLELPLAAAYHQRASRSFAQGDLPAALRDVERALVLDAFAPYRTTLAVVLDALGRTAEARRELDAVLAEVEPAGPLAADRRVDAWPRARMSDEERGRIHATRGLIALREGALTEAKEHLGRALSLHPSAFHAHSLGAALYALGDMRGAQEVEARSVELEPTETRYRWALIMTLRKLGREDEAREHAREILRISPGEPSHKERFARLFGAGS